MALQAERRIETEMLPVSVIDYVSGYLMAFGAMVALDTVVQPKAAAGWCGCRVARTGKWIVDRGMVEDLSSSKNELEKEELQKLLVDPASSRHLKPVLSPLGNPTVLGAAAGASWQSSNRAGRTKGLGVLFLQALDEAVDAGGARDLLETRRGRSAPSSRPRW
jgi:hypothetical protein